MNMVNIFYMCFLNMTRYMLCYFCPLCLTNVYIQYFYHVLYLSSLFLDHSHLKLHVLSFCLSVSPSLSLSKTYKTVIKQERKRKET